jgi:phosphate transport system substrate-binding protein
MLGRSRLVVGLVLSALLLAGLPEACAETLTVAGSTTFSAHLMVPYRREIEALADHNLVVVPNRTNVGLKQLFEQRTDLAMTSTALPNALALLRRANPDLALERLREFEIYRSRISFSVHVNNPVRSATLETMRRILLGEITNWRELGGPDLPIRVVMLRDGGGVQLTVEAQLLGGKRVAAVDPIRVQIISQVNKVVEQEPGALGLAQLEHLRNHHVFEILTEEPVKQHFSLVSLDEPGPALRAVIDAARKVAIEKRDP